MTAHIVNKLTALEVRTANVGKHSDSGGLWLHQREDGKAQWVLRITVHGRQREMGLGSTQDVSLKDARVAAGKWRVLAAQDVDPIKQREKERREALRNLHLLNDIATDAFESRKAELKGDGEAPGDGCRPCVSTSFQSSARCPSPRSTRPTFATRSPRSGTRKRTSPRRGST